MTGLKIERGILRSGVTRLVKQFSEECKWEEKIIIQEKIKDKGMRIQEFDLKIKDAMVVQLEAGKIEEEDLIKELTEQERYREIIITCISCKQPSEPTSIEQPTKLNLPHLELQKFDGDPKRWIQFWTVFESIHLNSRYSNEVKFQYLLNCIVPKSKARSLIDAYPPTANNYDKAISDLKERFAADSLLIEVYIRELLNLILEKNKRKTIVELYNAVDTQIRALEFLGVTSDKFAHILYPLVESTLPVELLRAWERRRSTFSLLSQHLDYEEHEDEDDDTKSSVSTKSRVMRKQDNLTQLMAFWKDEVQSEERIKVSRQGFGQTSVDDQYKRASHMALEEKRNKIIEANVCFACLNPGHSARFCKKPPACPKCTRKHFKVMCPEMAESKNHLESEPVTNLVSVTTRKSLLRIVEFNLINPVSGAIRQLFGLVDSGSDHSYVRTKIAQEEKLLQVGSRNLRHSTFGGGQHNAKHDVYHVSVKTNEGNLELEMLNEDNLFHKVLGLRSKKLFDVLKRRNIHLSVDKDVEVEVLLGADAISLIETEEIVKIGKGIVCQNTLLGWTIMGRPSDLDVDGVVASFKNLTNLWDLDLIGIRDPVEREIKESHDEKVLEHFLSGLNRLPDGRYEVKLPWSSDPNYLSESFEVAKLRMVSVKKRLERFGKLKGYGEVFLKWEMEGIVERCEIGKEGYFLPHRPVFKEGSSTPIRPVFDGSCQIRGVSINQLLETGPNMLEQIPKLLTKFRAMKVGFSADIRKAFLQISLQAEDREYLKFLWVDSRGEIIGYRHNRVVFGLTSSPFILNAVIQTHLKSFEEDENLKGTAVMLENSFYADNAVGSVNNMQEYNCFKEKATIIMNEGKFELTQWSHTMMEQKLGCCEANVCKSSKDTPLLGIKWDCISDELYCVIPKIGTPEKITKRLVLSIAQKVFDPLGMLSAICLVPRLLLQDIWKLKYGWDDELPVNFRRKFLQWLNDLRNLSDFRIPRCINVSLEAKFSLHTFADASKVAYGVCVFLRCELSNNVLVHFMMGKARVCPVKDISIARQELIAAVLGVRLAATVIAALNIPNLSTFYWTDSQIVWHWICGKNRWQVFIKNRVDEILKFTEKEDWYHLPGEDNPADPLSRSCTAEYLKETKWLQGPPWLEQEKTSWPIQVTCADIVPEEICSSMVNATTEDKLVSVSFSQYFSSYHKTVRMVAWMLRFMNNCKNNDSKIQGELTGEEFSRAELKLLGLVQKESLKEDNLRSFKTFVDNNGLIRIQTRLTDGQFDEKFKSPVLLPSKHVLIERLVYEKHICHSHAGLVTLMSILREEFFIIRSRVLIKKVLKKCVTCRKCLAKPVELPEAALPANRINPAKAFECSGVDLAGPLYLKCGSKAWIVLFTCAVYRAVHLEIVLSISTESFIKALRRFLARRGRVRILYSDQGTNFLGTVHLLNELNWDDVVKFSTLEKIEWKLNPPAAPWYGGFWERLVRVIKDTLKKVLAKAVVDYEELSTVLCDTEAVINARPLTYVSDCIDELIPLTPAHFIQDIYCSDVKDLDIIDAQYLNRVSRHIQELRTQLRNRFVREYTSNLLSHNSPRGRAVLKEGDVVLIASDSQKRIRWSMGRIIKLLPGRDGVERVAVLKTPQGELTRPVQRLCPLEVSEPELSNEEASDYESADTTQELRPAEVSGPEISQVNNDKVVTRVGRLVVRPTKLDI